MKLEMKIRNVASASVDKRKNAIDQNNSIKGFRFNLSLLSSISNPDIFYNAKTIS
jgi:hypothetical protein